VGDIHKPLHVADNGDRGSTQVAVVLGAAEPGQERQPEMPV